MTLENEIKTGIYPTAAIKPVGAGDSFMAGLLASIADGFNLKESVLEAQPVLQLWYHDLVVLEQCRR